MILPKLIQPIAVRAYEFKGDNYQELSDSLDRTVKGDEALITIEEKDYSVDVGDYFAITLDGKSIYRYKADELNKLFKAVENQENMFVRKKLI